MCGFSTGIRPAALCVQVPQPAAACHRPRVTAPSRGTGNNPWWQAAIMITRQPPA